MYWTQSFSELVQGMLIKMIFLQRVRTELAYILQQIKVP